ncbi:MAG: hypothetical protein AB1486_08135 [Planctomycetota bacterium]
MTRTGGIRTQRGDTMERHSLALGGIVSLLMSLSGCSRDAPTAAPVLPAIDPVWSGGLLQTALPPVELATLPSGPEHRSVGRPAITGDAIAEQRLGDQVRPRGLVGRAIPGRGASTIFFRRPRFANLTGRGRGGRLHGGGDVDASAWTNDGYVTPAQRFPEHWGIRLGSN